nr:(2Fe-2S)-binding protein [Solobacterium sp.]
GRIVCRCEQVSEGEIIDCIRRPCGATTVKGVKKRVRPGMGRCQGGFCEPLVLAILARELGKSPLEIVLDSRDSRILESENR